MKVKFIYDRWEHHAGRSGYDMIVPALGTRLTSLDYRDRKARIVPWRLASYFVLERAGMRHYSYHQFYAELTAALAMLRNRSVVYHIMEGDFGYRYLGMLDGLRGNRVVATYHLPPKRLATDITRFDHFKKLSAIILVGKNQIPFFEPHVSLDKLHWVPLGIDTAYFTPADDATPRRSKRCVFVGRHMRDLDTLKKVVQLMERDRTGIETIIVTTDDQRPLFANIDGVDVRTNVTDTELLSLYQSSDLMLLPVTDATAVIALLESLACGLPPVVTSIGGIYDYVDDSCAALVPPKDPEAMYAAVCDLLADDRRKRTLAENARQRALRFDWSAIISQLREIYSQVLNQA